jgi:Glycosyl transferase family 2
MGTLTVTQNKPRIIGNALRSVINNSMKTVICHFYNEEFLLPWWLTHHKKVFDHGIMIDYHSTDRSMEIIREICPDWEIRYTRNKFFDSLPVDEEVSNVEKILGGWRMCLNVTEFLYGNTDHFVDLPDPTQYFVGNYVFVDMEDPARGQTILDHRHPLHQQRYWGYDEFRNTGESRSGGIMGRMSRSIHNYPMTYTGGRHWGSGEKAETCKASFSDLAIFYYGWCDLSPAGLKRKTQIAGKIQEAGTVHHHSENEFATWGRELKNISRDLKEEIAPILEHNRRITGQEF